MRGKEKASLQKGTAPQNADSPRVCQPVQGQAHQAAVGENACLSGTTASAGPHTAENQEGFLPHLVLFIMSFSPSHHCCPWFWGLNSVSCLRGERCAAASLASHFLFHSHNVLVVITEALSDRKHLNNYRYIYRLHGKALKYCFKSKQI